jgi:hypothetical protein
VKAIGFIGLSYKSLGNSVVVHVVNERRKTNIQCTSEKDEVEDKKCETHHNPINNFCEVSTTLQNQPFTAHSLRDMRDDINLASIRRNQSMARAAALGAKV